MNMIKTTNYPRITKRQAEARYKTGQTVYILPCNMHPENAWQRPIDMNYPGRDFHSVASEYSYYNCDGERGRYPAYYISRAEYEERTNGGFSA